MPEEVQSQEVVEEVVASEESIIEAAIAEVPDVPEVAETVVEESPEAPAPEQQIEEVKAVPTPEQLRERESAIAKRENEQQQQLAQQRMQFEIQKAQQQENTVRYQEAQAVQSGQMTQEQANQRAQWRQQQQHQAIQLMQANQQSQQLRGQSEQEARFLASKKIGEMFSVPFETLFNDGKLDSPDRMMAAAQATALKEKDRAIEKLQADLKAAQRTQQQFDKPVGGGPGGKDGDAFVKWYETGDGPFTQDDHTKYNKYLSNELGIEI